MNQRVSIVSVGGGPWVRALLLSFALVFALSFLVVPLLSVFAGAFRQGAKVYWENLREPEMRSALKLTLLVALMTIPVNLLFGLSFAWLVTRFEFFGRKLLMTLVDVPFAVSPVIAGLICLLLYGRNGWLGRWLNQHDIQLMFSWPGLVLVSIFVTSPFVARELIPFMAQQGRAEEEAAITLGANPWSLFWRVVLPKIRLPLFYGAMLTNARAMGEFGAASVVSGTVRGRTNTLPLHVDLLFQDMNLVGAFVSATLLAGIALLTLMLQWLFAFLRERAERREAKDAEPILLADSGASVTSLPRA